MNVYHDKYRDPTPEQTPFRVIIRPQGSRWPTLLPVQLQGRISQQEWDSAMGEINDVASQAATCGQTCLALLCCPFGGLCWLISKSSQQSSEYQRVFTHLESSMFRPKGMQLSLQQAQKYERSMDTGIHEKKHGYHSLRHDDDGHPHRHHHHQQQQERKVTVQWIQIDIFTQQAPPSVPLTLSGAPPLLLDCSACKSKFTVAPGTATVQCPVCRTVLTITAHVAAPSAVIMT